MNPEILFISDIHVSLEKPEITRRFLHFLKHRPMIHNFKIGEHPAQRYVLADWKPASADVLSWNKDGYRIKRI